VEDYLQYARQLLDDYKDVLEEPAGQPADKSADKPAGSLFGFAGNASTSDKAVAGSSKPPLAPGGNLFGGGSSSGAPTAPGSIFGALPSTGGAFGLSSSAPAFGGFGGSGAASAANSGGSLFNVPSTGTLGSFSTGAATAGGDDDEGGEEEEGAGEPSVQVEAGEGTELLAKERVKLMSMSPDKKWKDKGQGTLTLRRATGEQAAASRPYFVFTTDSGGWGGGAAAAPGSLSGGSEQLRGGQGRRLDILVRRVELVAPSPASPGKRPASPPPLPRPPGRILINAPLVKGMKPTSNPKAPASLIMFLISSVEGKEERGMHLFKLESAEAAKKLAATVAELA
jgi:hypothetical protein